MPLYTYEVLDAAGTPTGETFEELESIKAPPLTEHNGRPVRRAFQGGSKIQRTWHGRETRSLALGINPEQVAQAKARTPSWEFDERTGDAVFTSDAHMRKCLKEQQAADARELDQLGNEQARDDMLAGAMGRAPKRRTDIPTVAEVARRSQFQPVAPLVPPRRPR